MTDLRALRYFVGIVQQGSLAAASRVLHVAQPALSHHLKRLEVEYGTTLLHREPRGVRPTPDGETLFRHAVGLLRQAESLRAAMSGEPDAHGGTVAVGLSRTLARMLALPLFERVRRAHPRLVLEVHDGHSAELGRAVAECRLDLALLMAPAPPRGTVDVAMVSEELVVVGPRAAGWWPPGTALTLRRLSGLPLLMSSRSERLYGLLSSLTAERKIALDVRGHLDEPEALLSAVEAGHGATVLPWCAVQDRLDAGRVSVRRIRGAAIERRLLMSRPRAVEPQAAAAAVAAALAAECRERIDAGRWRGAAWIAPADAPFAAPPAAVRRRAGRGR